jgi:hypothetical protein
MGTTYFRVPLQQNSFNSRQAQRSVASMSNKLSDCYLLRRLDCVCSARGHIFLSDVTILFFIQVQRCCRELREVKIATVPRRRAIISSCDCDGPADERMPPATKIACRLCGGLDFIITTQFYEPLK